MPLLNIDLLKPGMTIECIDLTQKWNYLYMQNSYGTEMANKFKSEKKKLLTRKPAITFEIQNPKYYNWWVISIFNLFICRNPCIIY